MLYRLLSVVVCFLLVDGFCSKNAVARLPASMEKKGISISIYTSANDSLSCTIPFNRAGNLIMLKAKVDTVEGNFILDTGAPYLILNETYFRDYPVTVVEGDEQTTIAGRSAALSKTSVKELSFGALQFFRVEADMTNLGNIENAKGIKVLGLLGLELFKDCELTIDFEKNLLCLHRIRKKALLTCGHTLLKDDPVYNTYPIELTNSRIITVTEIAGKKVKLIIDCAAESNILDSRLPDKIFDNVTITRRVKLTGPGDKKVDALYGNLNHMKMGNRDVADLPVIIINLQYTCFADGSCADGVLGFDFLSQHKIAFNFVSRKMYIWK
ncbi:MAG TPA: retropepsin-like aspartic protease [Flavisolibacter sp.]|jgi:hypothetical protein|nr:retropepsin-like aspartic protease [Flavisolibacter sp.]